MSFFLSRRRRVVVALLLGLALVNILLLASLLDTPLAPRIRAISSSLVRFVAWGDDRRGHEEEEEEEEEGWAENETRWLAAERERRDVDRCGRGDAAVGRAASGGDFCDDSATLLFNTDALFAMGNIVLTYIVKEVPALDVERRFEHMFNVRDGLDSGPVQGFAGECRAASACYCTADFALCTSIGDFVSQRRSLVAIGDNAQGFHARAPEMNTVVRYDTRADNCTDDESRPWETTIFAQCSYTGPTVTEVHKDDGWGPGADCGSRNDYCRRCYKISNLRACALHLVDVDKSEVGVESPNMVRFAYDFPIRVAIVLRDSLGRVVTQQGHSVDVLVQYADGHERKLSAHMEEHGDAYVAVADAGPPGPVTFEARVDGALVGRAQTTLIAPPHQAANMSFLSETLLPELLPLMLGSDGPCREAATRVQRALNETSDGSRPTGTGFLDDISAILACTSTQDGQPLQGGLAPVSTALSSDGQFDIPLPDGPGIYLFGSVSCPPFLRTLARMLFLFQLNGLTKLPVTVVYTREAHAAEHRTLAEREEALIELRQLVTRMRGSESIRMRFFMDALDDRTARAFSSFPSRVFGIDHTGHLVFVSTRGPPADDTADELLAIVLAKTGKKAVAIPADRDDGDGGHHGDRSEHGDGGHHGDRSEHRPREHRPREHDRHHD